MAPHPPFELRPGESESVFRLVETLSPTAYDFLSDEQAGRYGNPDTTIQSVATFRGFSVSATLAQARSLARLLRRHGRRVDGIAELQLLASDGDGIARTFQRRGHHTVWAFPDRAAGRVVRVHDVQ